MIAIREQEKKLMKKRYTERKFSNKTRYVCEKEDCYIENIVLSKDPVAREIKMKTLSLQVIILYSKEYSFM